MSRLYITTADIQQLTGKDLRHAQRLLQSIKDSLGKEKRQLITFREFCSDTGTHPDELTAIITDALIPKNDKSDTTAKKRN